MNRVLLAALAALALTAAPAGADSLEVAATGARNLDQAAGWMAWVQPDGDRWRLTVRAPDGAVTQPAVGSFGAPMDPTVAATRRDGSTALVPFVVYSRCAGDSTTRGCDVLRLDLESMSERPVAVAATETYSETAPAASGNVLTFVRRGSGVPERRKGVHFASLRDERRGARRLYETLARETKTNGSRVAYNGRRSVVVRRLSEPTQASILFAGLDAPHSLVLDRYRVGWLGRDLLAVQSGRFGGSGDPTTEAFERANRRLPVGTSGIALLRDSIRLFADDAGIHRIEPKLFRTE